MTHFLGKAPLVLQYWLPCFLRMSRNGKILWDQIPSNDFMKWFHQMISWNGSIKWFHEMIPSNDFTKWFHQTISSNNLIKWFHHMESSIESWCLYKITIQSDLILPTTIPLTPTIPPKRGTYVLYPGLRWIAVGSKISTRPISRRPRWRGSCVICK